MVIDDAYAELGLAPGATETEVKAAWRRLASRWHPDRNNSAAAAGRMQRINQALEQIRRSGYAGDAPAAQPPAEPAKAEETPAAEGAPAADESPGQEADAGPETAAAAEDAGAAVRTISRRVRLTLEEAAAGCIKVLRGKLVDRCPGCAGAGFQVLGGACAACDGAGKVRQRAWYGWFGAATECEACGGAGVARKPCEGCGGSGKLPPHEYRIHVRIPHGVRDGDLLQVGGRRARAGQPALQLELRVELLPHALFRLDADGTVHGEVPVDGFAWMANRQLEVPTLGGLHRLRLSREQLSYRLAGQGFPTERRGPRGDHVVQVQPVFPEQLSADQEILLDQLVASGGAAVPPRLAEWRRAMREWKKAHAQHA